MENISKILIVDDSDINVKVMSMYVQRAVKGCTVKTAMNGRQALDVLKEFDDCQLAFVDFRMPVMDGFELTENIRKLHGDSMYIIGVTADVDKVQFDKGKQAGMNRVLAKPIKFDTITALFKTD